MKIISAMTGIWLELQLECTEVTVTPLQNKGRMSRIYKLKVKKCNPLLGNGVMRGMLKFKVRSTTCD